MIQRQVNTSRGTFSVEDTGGSKPPVVLLHGGASNLRAWDNVIPKLADRLRCISFDLPAHGLSQVDAMGFQQLQAALVEAWTLMGVTHPIVVGHSFGGLVAAFLGNTLGVTSGVMAIDPYLSDNEVRRKLPDLSAALDEVSSMKWPWPDTTQVDREVDRVLATYQPRPDEANLRAMIKRGYRPVENGVFRRYPRPEDEMKGVESNWSVNVLDTFKGVKCPLAIAIATSIPAARLESRRRLVQEILQGTGQRSSSEFACPHDVPGYLPEELGDYIGEWTGSIAA